MGNYSVIITDAHSCPITISDTVLALSSAILSNISVINPQCLPGIKGSIIVNPTGGIMPYQYLWTTNDTVNSIDSLGAGTYSVHISDSLGCILNDTIALTDSSSLVLTNSGQTTICAGSSISLSVPQYQDVSYSWSHDSSILPDTINQIIVTQSGDYSVMATTLCGIFNAGPVTISVNPLPVVTVSSDARIKCDSVITLTASGGVNYSWLPANSCTTPGSASTQVSPEITTLFTVTVSDSFGCSVTDSVLVNVICDSLFIPGGFSPNADGVNDFFVISDISKYPDAILKIFNRWGELVYIKEHYDNSWNGFSNSERLRIGKVLPNGTYFYIFSSG